MTKNPPPTDHEEQAVVVSAVGPPDLVVDDEAASSSYSVNMSNTSIGGDDGDGDGSINDEEKQQQEEVLEIQKRTQQETSQVRRWKFVVTALLLATAVAVTVTAYYLLDKNETKNFEIAYDQFARTVANAAVGQQQALRDSIAALANTISIAAETNNVNTTWPNFYPPKFQVYAQDFLRISNAEFAGLNNIVTREQRESFEEWSTQNYQAMIQESHMVAYGNLDLLDRDESNYHPYISQSGTSTPLEPDIDRDYHSVRLSESPPARAYGPTYNLNIATIGQNGVLIESLIELRNELLVSSVKPFQALPEEEHAKFHEDKPEGADYPHSFFYFPVLKVADDLESEIVSSIVVSHAWDVAMRNLLPESVNGIYCVLKNGCGQVFSFVINGLDVSYLGEEDFHDPNYNEMELLVDLTPHSHPNYTTTPGHCTYTMQIYPSDDFKEAYDTNLPEIFAAVVAAIFGLVVLVFCVYDVMVKRRNDKLVNNAAQSNALVASLFPGMFRDRVLDERAEKANTKNANAKKQKKRRGKKKSGRDPTASGAAGGGGSSGPAFLSRNKSNLSTFLNDGGDKSAQMLKVEAGKAPLADEFPETTVLFADIVGFTSWSSLREPSQVFTLLETIYAAFDKLAKKRKVFKVETIGDCYVAVAGLPEPLPDHAVAMARFAYDCLAAMTRVTRKLEDTLGPGTRDLLLRVGCHSGPVIAGVLRGERARFQLFGDTMNTASRMESTSVPSRIQVSHETARLLTEADKDSWLEKREDKIVAKGKGVMQTYWLRNMIRRYDALSSDQTPGTNATMETVSDPGGDADSTATDDQFEVMMNASMSSMTEEEVEEVQKKLVDWNAGLMRGLLREIIAQRRISKIKRKRKKAVGSPLGGGGVENDDGYDGESVKISSATDCIPVEEMVEVIDIAKNDTIVRRSIIKDANIAIPEDVNVQLTHYIATIAGMYRSNSFHGFDHASHVAMSMAKLLSSIVPPTPYSDISKEFGTEPSDKNLRSSPDKKRQSCFVANFRDHTFGITNDAMAKFACVFAALIHDVGHTGVPNSRLQEENVKLSGKYKNRSVAEQYSFDMGWNLLMEGPYPELRALLWEDKSDIHRFRQIVINCIMATDLFDSDLKTLRQDRWDKAFVDTTENDDVGGDQDYEMANDNDVGKTNMMKHLKATVVVEHLIQASDISHTMQGWHVYLKWNERLFEEMYAAYSQRRTSKNPADYWYEGELDFFDNFVIPLATKLRDCGVFGREGTGDEFVNYAISNRKAWESQGLEVVSEMSKKIASEQIVA